jgi:hypothetical protein
MPPAEQVLDAVRTELRTGREVRRLVEHHRRHFEQRPIDHERRAVVREERFDLASQLVVARAGLGQKRAALARFPLENQFIEVGDALPPLGIHVGVSPSQSKSTRTVARYLLRPTS